MTVALISFVQFARIKGNRGELLTECSQLGSVPKTAVAPEENCAASNVASIAMVMLKPSNLMTLVESALAGLQQEWASTPPTRGAAIGTRSG